MTAEVSSPGDAAALVIATNPIFAGALPETRHDRRSKRWSATPLTTRGYEITMTVGWGDCMAGCIERHVWTTPFAGRDRRSDREQGDPVPAEGT